MTDDAVTRGAGAIAKAVMEEHQQWLLVPSQYRLIQTCAVFLNVALQPYRHGEYRPVKQASGNELQEEKQPTHPASALCEWA